MLLETLSSSHDRARFNCGEASLDDYIRLYANQHDKKGLGKTYVTIGPDSRVLGYYTISSSSVAFESVPSNLPAYPIPVVLLGRLAVDLEYQGRGLGKLLLVDALKRAGQVADILGVYAVAVEALHEKARDFYLKYGFTQLLDNRLHLYLSMKTIRKLKL